MTEGETKDGPRGLPQDEREIGASLTPTEAKTDPAEAEEEERKIEFDSGLSPAVEQQGGAALANIGKRRASDLFRD